MRRNATRWSSQALVGFLLCALGCGSEPVDDEAPLLTAEELPTLDPRTLDPRAVHDIAAGASERYRFHLEKGAFVHLVVEPAGVDVKLTVEGPRGEPLLEVDDPSGREAAETIFLVAETAGDYLLEVAPFDQPQGGHFSLRVEAWRQATAEDRQRFAALRATGAGVGVEEALKASGDAAPSAGVATMIAHYQEASRLWRELGEETRTAWALYRLGRFCAKQESCEDAGLEALENARDAFHRLGDRRQEAFSWRHLATLNKRRDPARALACYQASRDLFAGLDDLSEEAAVLNDMAMLQRKEGRIHAALELYPQALERWQRLGNRAFQAITLTNMGYLYVSQGQIDRAVELFRRALAHVGSEPSATRAVALNRLGDALLQLPTPPAEAFAVLNQALEMQRGLGQRNGEAVALNSLGLAQLKTHRAPEALPLFLAALAIFEEQRDDEAIAIVLGNLGLAYEQRDQRAAARQSFQDSLARAHRLKNNNAELQALFGLARVAASDDELPRAESFIRQAIDVIESIRARNDRPDLRSAYLASQQDHYDFLIEILVERQHRESGEHLERAFEVNERARARSLLEGLAEIRSSLDRTIDAADLAERDALRDQINTLHLALLDLPADGQSEPRRGRIAARLESLLESFRQVEARIARQSPRYSALTGPRILSLAAVREELLDDDTLLLEFHLGQKQSLLWAATTSESRVYELPERAKIERSALDVHEQMLRSNRQTNESTAWLAAAELGKMLLAPALAELPRRRLVMVVTGALQYVPFAALPNPTATEARRPLIADHEIVSLPSASVLAMLRETAGRRTPKGKIAVLADAVYDNGDQRLPRQGAVTEASRGPERTTALTVPSFERLEHSRREAEAILDLAGDGGVLAALGFDAERRLVEGGMLGDYRLLHFATHGVFDAEHPELSALLLSRFDAGGRPVDGYLRAYELYSLDLAAELVVLSACQTALGEEIRGEGLVGLTSGLLHAGARRVVVSLWNVHDRATAELMEHFYRGLLRQNLPPAEALRQAQLALWQDATWRAPAYWAGFVLQGDWRMKSGPKGPRRLPR